MGDFSFQINPSEFRRGLSAIAANTQKLPHQIVNRAIFSTAIRARKAMPKVEAGTVDRELAITYAQDPTKLLKSGKISTAKKNRIALGGINAKYSQSVPLAALIISARANPNSNFNLRTQNRYRLPSHPLKGLPFASPAARNAMRAAVNRMVRARHTSTGFFKQCAAVIQFLFAGFDRGQSGQVAQPPSSSPGAATGGGSISKRIGKLANATPARQGLRPKAQFLLTGTAADARDALHKIAEPVWQRAIDAEGRSMLDYAARAYQRAARSAGARAS